MSLEESLIKNTMFVTNVKNKWYTASYSLMQCSFYSPKKLINTLQMWSLMKFHTTIKTMILTGIIHLTVYVFHYT